MLVGAVETLKDARNTQQFIAGGGSALPQDSMGKPWTGENVTATGDLAQDLIHNFFLESGARREKLRVKAGLPKEPTGVVAES